MSLILSSFLIAMSAFAELYDSAYSEFEASLEISLASVSSDTASLDERLFGVGTEWLDADNSSSNRVVSVSGRTVVDEDVIRTVTVECDLFGIGEKGTVSIREYASRTNSFHRMVLSYVANSMPVSLSLSRCDRLAGVRDCGVVKYPIEKAHVPTNIVSVSVVRGNVLLTTWGFSGSNHVHVASAVLSRAFESVEASGGTP